MAFIAPQTELAKIYGAVTTGDGFRKSGLTPIAPFFPSSTSKAQDPSSEDFQRLTRNKVLEDFQRLKFLGFTTRELFDLDAICILSRPLKPGDLDPNMIMPCLRQERWESRVDAGQPRMWLYTENLPGPLFAFNPVVWDALKPCLVLASYMFRECHYHPFVETVLCGMRDFPDANRIPPTTFMQRELMHTVKPRTLYVQDKDVVEAELKAIFNHLEKKLGLAFMHAEENPRSGQRGGCVSALTVFDGGKDGDGTVTIFLDRQLIRPLLLPGVSDAERIGAQWFLANTLCHELLHAMHYTSRRNQFINSPHWQQNKDMFVWDEPYYLDEPISELGWALEHHIFGGAAHPMLPDEVRKFGYWMKYGWPVLEDTMGFLSRKLPILNTPPVLREKVYYPIKISLFEGFQSRDFWEVGVKAFGSNLLNFRSVQHGVRVPYIGGALLAGLRAPKAWGNHAWSPDQWFAKVLQLENNMHKTPMEVQAQKFAADMLYSTLQGERFWDKAQEQRDRVVAIYSGSLTGSITQIDLVDRMKVIFEAHAELILDTQAAELRNQSALPDKRVDILAFNYGVRIFLQDLISANAQNVDLISLLMKFDLVRMIVWDPTDEQTYAGIDGTELDILREAWTAFQSRDFPKLSTIYDGVFTHNTYNQRISIFTRNCLYILVAGSGPETAAIRIGDLDSRIQVWREKSAQLDWMRNEMNSPNYVFPPGWKTILNEWVANAALVFIGHFGREIAAAQNQSAQNQGTQNQGAQIQSGQHQSGQNQHAQNQGQTN